MAVNSRSISGYLRFAVLAKLRPLRRKTFRFRQEQEAIEAWLRLIVQAASLSVELAIEIAECAGLIKGYGDTHRRGSANYNAIATQVIAPALAGAMPRATGRRCRCQRAHGGAGRSGGRSFGEVSCRSGKRAGARHCRRIATKKGPAGTEPRRQWLFPNPLVPVRAARSLVMAQNPLENPRGIVAQQAVTQQILAPQIRAARIGPRRTALVGARHARKRCARSRHAAFLPAAIRRRSPPR